MLIKPQPLTEENFDSFTPFGEVIGTARLNPIVINNGFAERYNRVMTIDTGREGGTTIVSIFSARKRQFPLRIDMMEKHPLGSQAFIPLKETTWLAFLAPPGDQPDLTRAEGFIIPPGLGYNLKLGVWHFPLISTEDMNFLVIDRDGPGVNLTVEDISGENIFLDYRG